VGLSLQVLAYHLVQGIIHSQTLVNLLLTLSCGTLLGSLHRFDPRTLLNRDEALSLLVLRAILLYVAMLGTLQALRVITLTAAFCLELLTPALTVIFSCCVTDTRGCSVKPVVSSVVLTLSSVLVLSDDYYRYVQSTSDLVPVNNRDQVSPQGRYVDAIVVKGLGTLIVALGGLLRVPERECPARVQKMLNGVVWTGMSLVALYLQWQIPSGKQEDTQVSWQSAASIMVLIMFLTAIATHL
jgi:hypothetical protein